MRKTLRCFNITLEYDATKQAVLVRSAYDGVIDFHHARSRRDAKKVMSRIENDFHNIARGMEVL